MAFIWFPSDLLVRNSFFEGELEGSKELSIDLPVLFILLSTKVVGMPLDTTVTSDSSDSIIFLSPQKLQILTQCTDV